MNKLSSFEEILSLLKSSKYIRSSSGIQTWVPNVSFELKKKKASLPSGKNINHYKSAIKPLCIFLFIIRGGVVDEGERVSGDIYA